MPILCANPKAQYDAHRDAIDAAIRRVLEGGHYILGPELQAFEREFAGYLWGSSAAKSASGHAVGVANGTDAIRLALRALGVRAGDEVIAPSHTAVATIAAIEQEGAVPVLVDIEPRHYTMDPGAVESALTARTQAVIAVHLYGQAADLESIQSICRKRGLPLIEDCAQSTGAELGGRKLGTFGELSCFSFYPTKNLGAIGDGGMVACSSAELAAKVRSQREYGWVQRVSEVPGVNSRLDELQAAVLRVKLPKLDDDNRARARIASLYAEGLRGLPLALPEVRPEASHVYHLYVLRTARRDVVKKHLESDGVLAGIHYPLPVHLQPAYRGRLRCVGRGPEPMAETEKACSEILSLPMYPDLSDAEVEQVIRSLRGALA